MSFWLLEDPEKRLKDFRKGIHKVPQEDFEFHEGAWRGALLEAWDQQPETFFELLEEWKNARKPRLRALVAGAAPLLIDEYTQQSLNWLKELSRDTNKTVRMVAIERLCGEIDALPEEMKRFARDKDAEVRQLVAYYLGESRKVSQYEDILCELANDPEPAVHWSATASIHRLFEKDSSILKDGLKQLAGHSDINIRWAIVINHFEPLFAEYFDRYMGLMRQWLRSGEAELRWTLVHSLRYTKATPPLQIILGHLLEDKDPVIRCRVFWQMAELKPLFEFTDVEGMIERGLTDDDESVRKQAENLTLLYRRRPVLADPEAEFDSGSESGSGLGDEDDDAWDES